ncbi:MAG: site-specific integrase [Microbacterium sp.]|jgi:site-specific recombinase XerD|nr:site-specific integrase [Microbacterium sp.]
MVEGWATQQQSRRLRPETVKNRLRLIERFRAFTGADPWEWRPGDLEDFTSLLLSGDRPAAHSTVRGVHVAIRLFCEYVSSPDYPWAEECRRRFGEEPVQICHRWNTAEHLAGFEGRSIRRPFDYDELQMLFDTADARVDRVASSRKKGLLAALRDAQIVKTAYAFGLRRREVLGLDLTDLRINPSRPEWGSYGAIHVRNGKSSNGGAARRRTVLTVPHLDWIVDSLRYWVEEARPLLDQDHHAALWPSERRGRLSNRTFDERFASIRDEAGLPAELTLHSLRHSYVTHLIEFGYSSRFVQDQVGHTFASTTAIYTSVADEYRHAIVRNAMQDFYATEE